MPRRDTSNNGTNRVHAKRQKIRSPPAPSTPLLLFRKTRPPNNHHFFLVAGALDFFAFAADLTAGFALFLPAFFTGGLETFFFADLTDGFFANTAFFPDPAFFLSAIFFVAFEAFFFGEPFFEAANAFLLLADPGDFLIAFFTLFGVFLPVLGDFALFFAEDLGFFFGVFFGVFFGDFFPVLGDFAIDFLTLFGDFFGDFAGVFFGDFFGVFFCEFTFKSSRFSYGRDTIPPSPPPTGSNSICKNIAPSNSETDTTSPLPYSVSTFVPIADSTMTSSTTSSGSPRAASSSTRSEGTRGRAGAEVGEVDAATGEAAEGVLAGEEAPKAAGDLAGDANADGSGGATGVDGGGSFFGEARALGRVDSPPETPYW